MPPVRNAMRFVNDKQPDADVAQPLLHLVAEQRLRRDQNQVQFVPFKRPQNFLAPSLDAAVQHVAAQPHPIGSRKLIFHQDQQRADHHRHTGTGLAHQLGANEVDQTFSPSGPLHHQDPFPGHHGFDCLVLTVAKFGALTV